MKTHKRPARSLSPLWPYPAVGRTILSDAEPPSDEERKQWQKDWFARKLDELWLVALGDKELVRAFCAKADSLKKPMPPRSKGALHALLVHYALAVEDRGEDRGKILEDLVAYNQRMTGAKVTTDTMNNRVTKAARSIDVDDLPDFARRAVKDRIDRGNRLHGK
jgi:hypothetical protein